MRLSSHEEYAQHWADESAHLDAHNIYEVLAGPIPGGRVLEIGCGTGKGTAQLERFPPNLSRWGDSHGRDDLIHGAGWMEAGMDGQAVIDGSAVAGAGRG